MTATATAATATASQQLSQSGKSPGTSRSRTKYPVQGNPSLRPTVEALLISLVYVDFHGSLNRQLAYNLCANFMPYLAPSIKFRTDFVPDFVPTVEFRTKQSNSVPMWYQLRTKCLKRTHQKDGQGFRETPHNTRVPEGVRE